ncbi:hypothetical protein MJO28_015266 [Puccinia striiformis f. sp. tritici]|uniref:Uncharacterized protein n=1 Tax=Puccinia striiformis f. sp. tritici TaxID=168172 RepID=A0ACC0DT78_9BASI|nr:hypothetical protein MJO28_015266 [Puccinia striiformis f. sp. tritici]
MFQNEESHGEELLKNQPIAKRNTGTELPTIGGPLSQLKVLQTTRPGLTNGTLILPSTFGTIYEGEDSVDCSPNAITINPRLIVEIRSPINQSESINGSIDTSKLSCFDAPVDESEDRSLKKLSNRRRATVTGAKTTSPELGESPATIESRAAAKSSLNAITSNTKIGDI